MSTATFLSGLRRRVIAVSVLAIVVLGAVVVGFELHRRRSLYWYDVKADYRYEFIEQAVVRSPVDVTQNSIRVPTAGAPWNTALLRLRVESRLSGSWFEPRVTVFTEQGTLCEQSLERGARGARYLNLCLTSAAVTPGTTIFLQGAHVTLQDQEAELLLFANPDPDTLRMLVLAPHPDDAEIGAFGLYARRDSWIVTVTNGAYDGAMYRNLVSAPTMLDSLQAEVRIWDSMVVPTWGGLAPERASNLGYYTLGLEPMWLSAGRALPHRQTADTSIAQWRRTHLKVLQDRPAVSSWENLVGDLVVLLTAIRPDVVVLPHPALDANRDHVFTAVALLEALEQLGDPPMDLLLYTNHHVLTEFYPFGPADAAVTLPPWFDPSVRFRSVYSHPLDERDMLAKIFALDAMHDLRDPPSRVLSGPFGEFIRRVRTRAGDVQRDPARELSYFRRSVRSNELFFRYTSDDRLLLQRMVPPRP